MGLTLFVQDRVLTFTLKDDVLSLRHVPGFHFCPQGCQPESSDSANWLRMLAVPAGCFWGQAVP